MGEIQAHSRIGASSYSRWSKKHGGCPASVRLSEGIPSVSSAYAEEGTEAHALASEILDGYFFGKPVNTRRINDASKDMKEAVKVYVDFVKAEAMAAKAAVKLGHVLIEARFDLTKVAKGAFGTADAIIYDAQKKKLIVADYKHGAGIAVDVEDNLQLMYYGLGALLLTGFPCDTVELVIIQPRCEHEDGPIRRFSFSAIELIDFAADLADDALATEDPFAPVVTGKHCRFCPAAPVKCPAIKEKAQAAAKLEFKETKPYNPEDLAKALTMIPALEAWMSKVREFAYGEAMHGRLPPGFKSVAKRGTRKWTEPEEKIVAYMADATKRPKEDFYEHKLKSPAQMCKLGSKQITDGLQPMMVTVSSGYNLVPESDPRPAVKMDPKNEFTKIESGEE